MDHIGLLAVGEKGHDVPLLVVELDQEGVSLTGPDSHGAVLATCEEVLTIVVYGRDSTAMSLGNFPDLSFLIDRFKAAEGSIFVTNKNCVVSLGVEAAQGFSGFLRIACV